MKITFIQPSMHCGKSGDIMEPLAFAFLKALTPAGITTVFHDERVDPIPFDERTDAVALSVNTFTARRAYQIARHFRSRGVPVIAGGFHPTLCPDEVQQFVDAVVCGDAEDSWPQVIDDLGKGTLKKRYTGTWAAPMETMPDRSIFADRKYIPVKPVQFGRGCPHQCDFCSIHAFYGHSLRQRPVESVAEELYGLRCHHILFSDDNLLHPAPTEQLLERIAPLGLRWSCHVSLDAANRPGLLQRMADSGCKSATVGFESLHPENLHLMGKTANGRLGEYTQAIRRFHDQGIMVYGTFVFGYDYDTPDTFRHTLDFALENQLFLANFNPLTPFPGTPLHARLAKEGRLIHPRWWLDETYRYGQAAFHPRGMSAEELEAGCYGMRSEFNRHRNIASRLLGNVANRYTPYHAAIYLASNLTSRKEIHRKQLAVLGDPSEPLLETESP